MSLYNINIKNGTLATQGSRIVSDHSHREGLRVDLLQALRCTRNVPSSSVCTTIPLSEKFCEV